MQEVADVMEQRGGDQALVGAGFSRQVSTLQRVLGFRDGFPEIRALTLGIKELDEMFYDIHCILPDLNREFSLTRPPHRSQRTRLTLSGT